MSLELPRPRRGAEKCLGRHAITTPLSSGGAGAWSPVQDCVWSAKLREIEPYKQWGGGG